MEIDFTTISSPSVLGLSINAGSVSCINSADGQAIAIPTGGASPYLFNWDNGEVGQTALFLTAGSHTITITDASNCVVTASFVVSDATPISVVNIDVEPVTCNGAADGSAFISASGGMPPYSYEWADGQVGQLATGLAAGVHPVIIKDQNACELFINVTVNEPDNEIVVTMASTDASCFGEADGSATVIATGGTPSYTYQWNNGATGATAFDLGAGTYSVQVIDQNGCQSQGTIEVDQPDFLFGQAETIDAICYGDDNGSIAVITATGGESPYLFSIDGAVYQTDSLFPQLYAGNYSVHIQDAVGCEFVLNNIIVDEGQNIDIGINAGPIIQLQLGEEIELATTTTPALPSLQYEWSPSTYLSCADCPNPITHPTDDILYEVIATDSLTNCAGTATVQVLVNKDRNIYIPNAFTPNGDGINDIFMVYGGLGVANIRKMVIYDRWGELIIEALDFAPDEPAFGWDGYFKGKPMNPGVFVYYIEAEFEDGVVAEYKGSITLLR